MPINQFKIGKVTIPNQLVLAPLDGINCAAFRLLCREHGAGLIYTAMVDCDKFLDILKDNKGNEKQTIRQVVNPQEDERPLTIQLVGSNKENLAQCASILSRTVSSCGSGAILNKLSPQPSVSPQPSMVTPTLSIIVQTGVPPEQLFNAHPVGHE